jgi:alanine dehydrogenase
MRARNGGFRQEGDHRVIVGMPKEIKNHEYRVGLTPAGAHALSSEGHRVLVERNAGTQVGFADAAYAAAGAEIVPDAAAVYGMADMVVKVKELQPAEYPLTRRGQILFCYHHFAPEPALSRAMLAAGVSCVAYETVTDARGDLPLLAPMSRIAGRLAPQMGAWALQMANGGSGLLLGGVPGVPPARVLVIGAGTVGSNATQIAVGMGADVMLFDRSPDRLEALDRIYRGRIKTCVADALTLAQQIAEADLVIGAVLIPGKRAPKLITQRHLDSMRPGSVLVDVSIDQGGIAETSRATTHTDPIYVEHEVVHYCVANMPGACARTSTLALTQVTLPYALKLAALGLREALHRDAGLREGLQIHAGRVTHAGLAQELGETAADALEALAP